MFFGKTTSKETTQQERIIIVGAGQVGSYVAKRLSLERKDVVVIDRDSEHLSALVNKIDIQIVAGEAFSPAVLRKAGIEEATIIIVATDSDEVNLSTCLLAHTLNPLVEKIVRIRNNSISKLYTELSLIIPRLTSFINPEISVVNSIIRSLYLPGINEYSEVGNGSVKLACFSITEGPLLDIPLSQISQIFTNQDFTVAAVNRDGQLYIPKGDTIIRKNDIVYFAFTEESLPSLLRAIGKEESVVRNIIIVGGGNIGYKLAKELENGSFSSIKIIESNKERATFLAENLNTTLVILGDATDESVLEGLSPSETDALVAVTGNEENNLIACLLARSLGTKETVCRLDRRSYISLAHLVGIDQTITPRLSAVNSILNSIRRGSVLSSISVGDDAAEALEFIITQDLFVANKMIQELALPAKSIVLAVITKDETIIARGSTILEVGSRILLMVDRNVVSEVERLFNMQG